MHAPAHNFASPKHTVESLAQDLVYGLESGFITLHGRTPDYDISNAIPFWRRILDSNLVLFGLPLLALLKNISSARREERVHDLSSVASYGNMIGTRMPRSIPRMTTLSGAGSAFSLMGNYYDFAFSDVDSDWEAIQNDVKAVTGDLRISRLVATDLTGPAPGRISSTPTSKESSSDAVQGKGKIIEAEDD
jgi:hypothetical protein